MLSAPNTVEEGLNDKILRDVAYASVDHQGWDLDLRESINYGPFVERAGPARLQISF